MAKSKKQKAEEAEQEPVGVLSNQPDGPFTSESDLAKSEDYDPQADLDPRLPGDRPGVLENRPDVSEPQGMDDILEFEGETADEGDRAGR